MIFGCELNEMLLRELTEYRAKIMKLLCSDQRIVDLINDQEHSACPDRSLMYSRIFPYAYTPDPAKETNTYVCFRLGAYGRDKTFKDLTIVFYVFTHQSHIRTSDGLRPDLIAERIENLFNGSLDFGVGRLKLENVDDISPASQFHGIALEYSVGEFNRPTIKGDPRAGAK